MPSTHYPVVKPTTRLAFGGSGNGTFFVRSILCFSCLMVLLLCAQPTRAISKQAPADVREEALRALWVGDTNKVVRLLRTKVTSIKSIKDADTASIYVALLAAELLNGNEPQAEQLRAKLMAMPFRADYIAGDTAVVTQVAEVAYIYQVRKKYAEAEGLYKRANSFGMDSHPEVTAQLAQMYEESGMKQKFAQLKRDGMDEDLYRMFAKRPKVTKDWERFYQRGRVLETAYICGDERKYFHSPADNGTLFGATIKCSESPALASIPLATTLRQIGDYYFEHDMRCDIVGPGFLNSSCKHGRFTADEISSVYERSLKMVEQLNGSAQMKDVLIARLGALRDLARQTDRAVLTYSKANDVTFLANTIDELADSFFPQITHPENEIFVGDKRLVVGSDMLYLAEDLSAKPQLDDHDCSRILHHRAIKLRPWTAARLKEFVDKNVVQRIKEELQPQSTK